MKDVEIKEETKTTQEEILLPGNYRVRIKAGFTEQKEAIVANSDVDIEWTSDMNGEEATEKLKEQVDTVRKLQKQVSQQVFEDHRDRAKAYTNNKLI